MKTKLFFLGLVLFYGQLFHFNSANGQTWSPGTQKLYADPVTTKVGIGTVNPSEELHIVNQSGNNYIQGIFQSNTNSGGISLINNNSYKWEFQNIGTGGGDIANSFALYDRNKNAYRFVINPQGNVGIGLNQPKATLHIKSGSFHSGSSHVTGLRIDNYYNGGSNYMLIDGDDIDVYGTDLFFQDYSPKNIHMVKGGGKVGIGLNPVAMPTEYRLGVLGGIITERIKVQVHPWADYVFEPDYRLRSLSEVEAFVKENKHLPEVPSAADVEANEGVELGAMNVLLLKKVEELTLYTIQQEKEISALTERADANNKTIEELKKLMEELKADVKAEK